MGPVVSDFDLGTSEPLLGCAAGLLDDLPASPALDAPEQRSALSIAWTQGLIHMQAERLNRKRQPAFTVCTSPCLLCVA